jgi:multimeric flavodoxin WrbA
MAKILILNGSPRKNGKTASLVKAFVEGAESVGNEIKELYLQGMNIGECISLLCYETMIRYFFWSLRAPVLYALPGCLW